MHLGRKRFLIPNTDFSFRYLVPLNEIQLEVKARVLGLVLPFALICILFFALDDHVFQLLLYEMHPVQKLFQIGADIILVFPCCVFFEIHLHLR